MVVSFEYDTQLVASKTLATQQPRRGDAHHAAAEGAVTNSFSKSFLQPVRPDSSGHVRPPPRGR